MFKPPTKNHLSRMYFELAKIGAACAGAKTRWPYRRLKSGEALVALASDMSRFDPRLFEILVQFFLQHWPELNPLEIRKCYKTMEWPQTVAVICEFFKTASDDPEVACFADYLSTGLNPIATQFYFFDLYLPGSNFARGAAEEGIYEFKKWGFLSAFRPVVDPKERLTAGQFDANSRRNILERLLEEKKVVGIGDYLKAIHYSISRQQAVTDIKASGLAKPDGKGRGCKWKLVA